MASLLAGFVAGYAMGLLVMGLLTAQVLGLQGWVRDFQRRFPQGTPLPMLTAALALGLQATWAIVGVVFGVAYWAIRADAANGLGSPAWGFTVVVLAIGAVAVAAATLVQPQWWRKATLTALCFVALFGWLLPNLAEA